MVDANNGTRYFAIDKPLREVTVVPHATVESALAHHGET